MQPWATSNAKLRADRDAMDEAKRLDAAPGVAVLGSGNVFADLGLPDADALLAAADARIAAGDCGCSPRRVCSHNAACPRLTIATGAGA